MKNNLSVKNLVLLAFFISLNVILSRFVKISFSSFARISFGFVAVVMMGSLFGPWYAALGAGLADIIGFMLFPTGEAFFIGFTLTAAVSGGLYGLFFYKKAHTLFRIVAAKMLVLVICNMLLNTLWLSILTGNAFSAIIAPRLFKNLATLPIDCFIIFVVLKALRSPINSTVESFK